MIGSKKGSVSTAKFNEEKLDSIVSTDITIEGKFKSTGNIRLDCTIIGDVDSESLFVGKSCNIKGTVNCENIIIAGKIDGNVFCNGKMHIKETGVIDGDIFVNILSMDEGSLFTGNCTRKNAASKKDAAPEIKFENKEKEKYDSKSFINREYSKEKNK